MKIDLMNCVVIVIGVGVGFGCEYVLLFVWLGVKVVVNDLGSDVNGNGGFVIVV